MDTTLTPAWNVIRAVGMQCHRAFMCEEIEVNGNGLFVARLYAAYKDPRTLMSKFTVAGGQVVEISGGVGNWWAFTFTVKV